MAEFKLKLGQCQEAASDYKNLIKQDPNDLQSIAGLVLAYSEYNPSLAVQYQPQLSSFNPCQFEAIDVDKLEQVKSRLVPREQ